MDATVVYPPFDVERHLKSPQIDESTQDLIAQVRSLFENDEEYDEYWCTDEVLQLFLIARNMDVSLTHCMLKTAGEWRNFRKPHLVEETDGWIEKMSKESETGKVYSPGKDQWGRPIIVLDNTVQNTDSVDDQMLFLAWNLEFGIKEMSLSNDKFLVFMHLDKFSFWNLPPFKSTKETIHMICNCYPERLGHAILFLPPPFFETFFNTIKMFIDPKTVSKMVFITGDVSDDSDNDIKLREMIGPDWKVLTGADQPVYSANCSPGYQHEKHWSSVLQRMEARGGGERCTSETDDDLH